MAAASSLTMGKEKSADIDPYWKPPRRCVLMTRKEALAMRGRLPFGGEHVERGVVARGLLWAPSLEDWFEVEIWPGSNEKLLMSRSGLAKALRDVGMSDL